MSQPVLLNADILQGNGAVPSKLDPAKFISQCHQYYSSGYLSLGWTTLADPQFPYINQNVDEMLELVKELDWITFPVRACLLPVSWNELQNLLQNTEFTLSLWNNEPIEDDLQDWIHENTDPKRIFYDFIDDNKEPMRLW